MSTLDHPAIGKVAAALAEAGHVGRADPAFVKEHTGQVIGGVAPVGHPPRLTTLVDTALRGYEVLCQCPPAHAKSVFPTIFDELLALTGGTAADVAADGQDIHP